MEQKLGTGAMITSAKKGEVDVIVALTEGLVAGNLFHVDADGSAVPIVWGRRGANKPCILILSFDCS